MAKIEATVARCWFDRRQDIYLVEFRDPAGDRSRRVRCRDRAVAWHWATCLADRGWRVTPSLSAGEWGAVKESLLERHGLGDRSISDYVVISKERN